ncbi:MAG TPA: ABC transporter substrate-binding protein [Ornithinimicrobium sp.]|uniref:ABC transporter substrate-binding protein n=1 Tax=Ornithinimicrobium sp. TaxID=1977084 RepID=UPI002B4A1E7D|nr:ABC transporter substrate-binding protein [Ornithinimicrobium sp.]HKJ11131.1 ABC transporter substrate-binding protein [Ornithinimicrobium sp.]
MAEAQRIVSLLPSATEILFALGAGEDVVGVTFECDEPAHARQQATVVSTSSLPQAVGSRPLTPAEIDAAVRARLSAGEDLYHLDRAALAGLDADLVVTQDLCAVCAVDVSEVHEALAYLGCDAEVLTTDPHRLHEVLDSIIQIGARCGREPAAQALVASLSARLSRLAGAPAVDAPAVAVLEWTDPPFAPGHWVPEMVGVAGGRSVLGAAGERSVPTTWEQVTRAEPDIVVVAPCGYDLASSVAVTTGLLDGGPLAAVLRSAPFPPEVWAVDANASFARPGPRLVDGVEALAAIVQPARHGLPDPAIAQRCTASRL